jgi:hypothetical protein
LLLLNRNSGNRQASTHSMFIIVLLAMPKRPASQRKDLLKENFSREDIPGL